MFRCVSELKGLIIDIDSFQGEQILEWESLVNHYNCLFITSDTNAQKEIELTYPNQKILFIEEFRKIFAPSINTHCKALQLLNLKTSELAYISKNITFINNAMEFLCGSIWVTDEINYDDASNISDLVCKDIASINLILSKGFKGFVGETALFPGEQARGLILPVDFDVDQEIYPLYMLGRYFGYSHYMNQLHPYSSAIFLNKSEGKKYTGIFNKVFAELFATAIRRIMENDDVYGICAVPPHSARTNRFNSILDFISQKYKILNLGENLKCNRDYPTQKNLTQSEREENVSGVFSYSGNINNKNVVIIDDVISTGATMRECIRVLRNNGASRIFVVVLAVNQIHEVYWSSRPAQVTCERCENKMHLLVNSHNNHFFYSCYHCHNTKNFEQGRQELVNFVNGENHNDETNFML